MISEPPTISLKSAGTSTVALAAVVTSTAAMKGKYSTHVSSLS